MNECEIRHSYSVSVQDETTLINPPMQDGAVSLKKNLIFNLISLSNCHALPHALIVSVYQTMPCHVLLKTCSKTVDAPPLLRLPRHVYH